MTYDRDTFELMIRNFCAEHVNDEDWGELPEVDKDSICFDQDKGEWTANCKFSHDDHLYTLVGDKDGIVTLYYDKW
jgi:hypothetical protein